MSRARSQGASPTGQGHPFSPSVALLSHRGPSLHQTSAALLPGLRGRSPFIPRILSGGRPAASAPGACLLSSLPLSLPRWGGEGRRGTGRQFNQPAQRRCWPKEPLPSSARRRPYLLLGTPGTLRCMENSCPLGRTCPILWLQTPHELKSGNNIGSDPF